MKRKEPTITQDELNTAVEEARKDFLIDGGEERPAGARSIQEWADLVGVSETTMRVRMRKAVAEEKYEKVDAFIRSTSGQLRHMPMYRKKKETPNAKSVDRLRRHIL